MTVRVSMEFPEDAFSALRTSPEGFVEEMRLAASVKWYEPWPVVAMQGSRSGWREPL